MVFEPPKPKGPQPQPQLYEGKQGHLTLEGQSVRLESSPTLSLNLAEKDSQRQQTGTFMLYLRARVWPPVPLPSGKRQRHKGFFSGSAP